VSDKELGRRLARIGAAPHRRRNVLTGEWMLVSPHRTARPWQGREEAAAPPPPAYDPACYLCPGNARAGGARNPRYTGTFAFDNDFAALVPEIPRERVDVDGLLVAEAAPGTCRVVCFSPRHDLHLGALPPPDVRRVVDVWADQTAELAARAGIAHVQVFENRGAEMGASNPHPHCQIWADELLPEQPARELARAAAHQRERGTCLLCDYLRLELEDGARVVARSRHMVALAPFWAVWPYELLIAPLAHRGALPDLDGPERDALADLLGDVVARYDTLFGVPFPYSMGFHQRPFDAPHPEWHVHAHYFPPLLRSATVRKFMVGYEMLAQPQRDLTVEDAAARLREVGA
jgi:UDPglucose--hexose-1-phosphate uridylyltransferase